MDESCQVIFEDVDKRSQTQCENIERRLQASLKKGLARQMGDIQKSLNSFTVEAQIANLQRLSAAGRGIRKTGQSVNFKASSAVLPGGPGDDGGDDGDEGDGDDEDYYGEEEEEEVVDDELVEEVIAAATKKTKGKPGPGGMPPLRSQRP